MMKVIYSVQRFLFGMEGASSIPKRNLLIFPLLLYELGTEHLVGSNSTL